MTRLPFPASPEPLLFQPTRLWGPLWGALLCGALVAALALSVPTHLFVPALWPGEVRSALGVGLLATMWGGLALVVPRSRWAPSGLLLHFGVTWALVEWASALQPNFEMLKYPLALQAFLLLPFRWTLGFLAVFFAVSVTGGLHPGRTFNAWDQVSGLAITLTAVALLLLVHRLQNEARRHQQLVEHLEAAQEKLSEAQRQTGVLEERARLARDLHDSLGHALAALTVQLEVACRSARSRPEQLPEVLQDAQHTARGAMAALRFNLHDLRAPPAPSAALERLARTAARRNGWTLLCRFEAQASETVVLIAAEALRNIECHAGPAPLRVTVSLTEAAADCVELIVQDEGCGFVPQSVPQGHFGLLGLYERAALVGGKLEIRSAPGRGTRIRAVVPKALRSGL